MYEQLPISFRQEIIQPLLATLRAGESSSLVGVGSSGKSNVARHLDRADVRKYYLAEAADRVLNLYVNCAKLTDAAITAHNLHSLILEVLAKASLPGQPPPEAVSARLRDLWKEAVTSDSAELARSNLEDGLAAVFQAGVEQVFITFDDFDAVVVTAPGPVLNSLRALRDDFKTKIMFVTVTRRELEFLRNPADFEDLLELVAPKTMAIGPYGPADASFMVRRLAARETPPRTISGPEEARLLELSGRHAGLIRAIYGATKDGLELLAADLAERLQTHPDVIEECERIWHSLEPDEQEQVLALVSQGGAAGDGSTSLRKKGIIVAGEDGALRVFSPLLAGFLAAKLPDPQLRLLPGKRVRVGSREIGNLDDIEYHLLSTLANHFPEAASREAMLEQMLAAEARQPRASGPPERRLEVYLRELKRKLETGDREYVTRLPDGRYQLQSKAR